MNAPLKVEAQIHFSCTYRLHPRRRGRREIERNNIIRAKRVFERCLSAQLILYRVEPDEQTFVVNRCTEEIELRGFECRGCPFNVKLG